MPNFMFVGDIVESNGQTIKQNNLNIQHDIPLGSLVEIIYKSNRDHEEEDDDEYGLRLFVVNHSRDCDGTPLYDLSFDKKAYQKFQETENKIKEGKFENRLDEVITHRTNERFSGAMILHYSGNCIKLVNPCE